MTMRLDVVPEIALPADLPVGCYRFSFEVIDPLRMPRHAGSMWRGAFGHAFREVACSMPLGTACEFCDTQLSCPYPPFFEEVGPGRRDRSPPRPFILEPDISPPGLYRPGTIVAVDLKLVGGANQALLWVIQAMQRAGENGVGARRARLILVSVHQETPSQVDGWRVVFEPECYRFTPADIEPVSVPLVFSRVRLDFTTPLRLKRDNRLITSCEEFSVQTLVDSVIRRVTALRALYCCGADTGSTPEQCVLSADPILSCELVWCERERWSNRQNRRLKQGGLIGHVVLDGSLLVSAWQWLWLGQWLHVGNGAAFGLGRYVLNKLGP